MVGKSTYMVGILAGFMLMTSVVSAAIIYSVPAQPIDIRRPSISPDLLHADIDLTGNGEGDLRFGSSLVASDPFMWPYLQTAVFDMTPLSAVQISSYTNMYGTFASPVASGTLIAGPDDALEWSEVGAMFSYYFLSRDGGVAWDIGRGELDRVRSVRYTTDLGEPSHEGKIGYFALEIQIDDETFFGWIEVDTRWEAGIIPDGGAVTRWAINSNPNEPIRAGEIPEPAAAATLVGAIVLILVLGRRLRG